jgi:hypothetical protein
MCASKLCLTFVSIATSLFACRHEGAYVHETCFLVQNTCMYAFWYTHMLMAMSGSIYPCTHYIGCKFATCTCMHTCACSDMYAQVHTCIQICMHLCIRVFRRTHIHGSELRFTFTLAATPIWIECACIHPYTCVYTALPASFDLFEDATPSCIKRAYLHACMYVRIHIHTHMAVNNNFKLIEEATLTCIKRMTDVIVCNVSYHLPP